MEIGFDQHFMKKEEILDVIVDSINISSSDVILEVGPGPGFLTSKIIKKNPKNLFSVEIDSKFNDILEEFKQKNKNFDYEIANALDVLSLYKFNKLVGNIPYSITETLYSKLLEIGVQYVVFLHGDNFFKIMNSPKSKWYYFVSSYYNIELVDYVDGEYFDPQTRVRSVVVKLTKKNQERADKFFYNLFLRRDRTLRNAVIYSFVETDGISKTKAKEIFDSYNLPLDIIEKKLDNLSNEEFVLLVEKLVN